MRLERRPERARRPGRSWLRRLAALLLASGMLLWAQGCLDDGHPAQVAGGTGSEAGDAYGEVWSVRGEKRAVSAQVRLYASAESLYTHPDLRSETATDSAGRFHFPIAHAGTYDLEIRSGDGAELIYRRGLDLPGKGETDLGVFHLAEIAAYRGRLPASPVAPTTVWLAGTPFWAQVDSTGVFSFPALPPGDYPVFTERAGVDSLGSQVDSLVREAFGSVQLSPGDTLAPPADTLPKPPVVVPDTSNNNNNAGGGPWSAILEDFNDGGAQSAWGLSHGGGMWSAMASGAASMIPSTEDFASAVNLAAGRQGKGLEVVYRAEPLIQATASVVLNMEKPLSAQLQRTDTLAFWARGDGHLVVRLHFVWVATAAAPQATARSGSASINLTPAWREYKIPVSEDGPGRNYESWIEFTGWGGSFYRLDDISVAAAAR